MVSIDEGEYDGSDFEWCRLCEGVVGVGGRSFDLFKGSDGDDAGAEAKGDVDRDAEAAADNDENEPAEPADELEGGETLIPSPVAVAIFEGTAEMMISLAPPTQALCFAIIITSCFAKNPLPAPVPPPSAALRCSLALSSSTSKHPLSTRFATVHLTSCPPSAAIVPPFPATCESMTSRNAEVSIRYAFACSIPSPPLPAPIPPCPIPIPDPLPIENPPWPPFPPLGPGYENDRRNDSMLCAIRCAPEPVSDVAGARDFEPLEEGKRCTRCALTSRRPGAACWACCKLFNESPLLMGGVGGIEYIESIGGLRRTDLLFSEPALRLFLECDLLLDP